MVLKVIEVTKRLVEDSWNRFRADSRRSGKIHPGRDSSSKINFNPYLSPLALSFSSFLPPLSFASLRLVKQWRVQRAVGKSSSARVLETKGRRFN